MAERESMVISQFIQGQKQDLVPFLLPCQFTSIDQVVNMPKKYPSNTPQLSQRYRQPLQTCSAKVTAQLNQQPFGTIQIVILTSVRLMQAM